MQSSHTLEQLDICFDDTHAIANTGLLLPATLAERLGIEQTAVALIDLRQQPGAHRPGRKLLTLVHTMLAGGDCIDDADLLRCGATSRVLGHRVMAPSTLGAFLRAFTFGHERPPADQAEQQRPRRGPLRRRSGGTGAPRGAAGELTIRMDSGFWSAKTIRACRRHGIRYSITVRQTKPIRAAIATIPGDAWTPIVYADGGAAQVAETRYKCDRLIVRRTRLVGEQAERSPTGATTRL